ESLFSEGIGFDGSSIRGFQKIHESDMLLLPDPDTAFLDPACNIPTQAIICDVIQPGSGERYSRDPRFIAKKAEAFLAQSGTTTRWARPVRPRSTCASARWSAWPTRS